MINQQIEMQKGELSSVKKLMTLKGFYSTYPYRKQTHKTSLPYVPASIENKKYSLEEQKLRLTYSEWLNIIIVFFEELFKYLLTGRTYKFSSGIGEWQIVKYKAKKERNTGIDFPRLCKYYSKKTGLKGNELRNYIKNLEALDYKPKYNNRETSNWKFKLAWGKAEYKFRYYSYWRVRIIRKFWTSLHNILKENPELYDNFKESRYYYGN